MSDEEKTQFVKDLLANVSATVIGQIKSGKIPADWGGGELRVLLAYDFSAEASRFTHLKKEVQQVIVEKNL